MYYRDELLGLTVLLLKMDALLQLQYITAAVCCVCLPGTLQDNDILYTQQQTEQGPKQGWREVWDRARFGLGYA